MIITRMEDKVLRFKKFFDLNFPKVKTFAWQLLKSEEDADEYTMQIDIKDFIRSGDFGIINGELDFSTSKYEKYKLNMLFNGEDKTQKLVWNLLKDDKKIVTMDQSMVYGNAAEEIKIPGGSDKVYNISDETEMEEYANSLSYTDFIEKFKEKFNIEALMKDAQAISENI